MCNPGGRYRESGNCRRHVQTAIDSFGRIDVLVNNAGINMRSSSLEMKLEDWQRVMDVNLKGTLHCCRAVLPYMIKQQSGKIVNISSTASKTPHRNAAPSYGAAKAGVNYLTQHLALEMAKHGIYVNAICPGPIETDMSTQWSEEYRQQVLLNIPLGRLGMPENVADGVLFLASKMSDFITGETININGGTYMN
jgi:3-oxoacyl-[acyl-carrier protein] reductase